MMKYNTGLVWQERVLMPIVDISHAMQRKHSWHMPWQAQLLECRRRQSCTQSIPLRRDCRQFYHRPSAVLLQAHLSPLGLFASCVSASWRLTWRIAGSNRSRDCRMDSSDDTAADPQPRPHRFVQRLDTCHSGGGPSPCTVLCCV